MPWHDLIGTTGAAMIVVSYALLQLERIASTELSYSLLNAAGAALILISLIVDFNFAAFLIESFWLLISVIGIVRFARRARA